MITEDPVGAALLTAVIETIVPSDVTPSAVETGGIAFWHRVLAAEQAAWRPRVVAVLEQVRVAAGGSDFVALTAAERLAVLDRLVDDAEYRWFAAAVNHAYYADPANGGNDGAASWAGLGWRPEPAEGWPENAYAPVDRSAVIGRDALRQHYDAVVVGSGAGGGVAAWALTAAGRTVLVVERGDLPQTAFLAQDHLRNARTDIGFDHRTLPSSAENPRVLDAGGPPLTLGAADPRWGSNAYTVGGGTRIYGAQAWRFVPEDFTMASTYGVPEGSALADWPVGYAEMEPFYSVAEWEIGVAGSTVGDSLVPPRSRDFPMPPLPLSAPSRRLAEAAVGLGLSTLAVPLAINSVPYAGRPACVRCGQCVGFACPVEAKNGSHNTTLARAAATGRLSVITGTRAARITTDGAGRVTGVLLVGDVGGSRWTAEVTADDVVVSAGAVESARLLLSSTSDQEPTGLGNRHDQVGRYLQGHLYGGALGLFEDPLNDFLGPGPGVATNDYRHHNPGLVGGGMIANEFVPTAVSTYEYLRHAGLVGPYGLAAKQAVRSAVPRMQRIVGPTQEMTSADCRVRLDPTVTDSFGLPVARLSGHLHPEDHNVQTLLGDVAERWLRAAGASTVTRWGRRPDSAGPSSGQHQAGSCRMGTDPATSATDASGRVWGHDNLRVVDGSLNVTNGGVNPVLTIFANAFRIMHGWVGLPAGVTGPPATSPAAR